MPEPRPPWPHAPTHQLSVRGTYFLTASMYLKAHHFRGKEWLQVLRRRLALFQEGRVAECLKLRRR